MKTIAKLILVSITLLSFSTSNASVICNEINGTKTITESFTHIEIDGAFTVIINQGNKENVVIESENSMMPYIKSSVKNNTLKIKLKTGIGTKNIEEIKLHITIKSLESLKLSGFINLETSKQINLEELILKCSGAVKGALNSNTKLLTCKTSSFSEIELLGSTDNLKINKTDASSVDAFKLKAKTVNIKSTGFGKVNVSVKNSLSVKSNGATEIKYSGNPEITEIDIEGFSTLNKKR